MDAYKLLSLDATTNSALTDSFIIRVMNVLSPVSPIVPSVLFSAVQKLFKVGSWLSTPAS